MKYTLQPKKRYVLSDGNEVTKAAWMTAAEYREAQQKALEASGGNWSWYQDDHACVTYIPAGKEE